MICNCGSYVSGESCKVCGHLLKEPKARTKAINKRSAKGEKEDLVYRALRQKFLKDNPRCMVFPDKKATDIHHVYGRSGGNYLNVKTWMAVSRIAHEKIHREHQWAVDNGYIKSRLAKEDK